MAFWEVSGFCFPIPFLAGIIHDPSVIARIAIYKGLLFVLTTALLLYHLIARHVLRLTRANRGIAASEERFQAIYDNMLEAVLILDPESGKVVDVNRTTCELFGFSRSEAFSLTIQEICSDDSSVSESEPLARLRLAAKGIPQLVDRVARKKDGSLFWADISMRKVDLKGEERVIALVRDISERKKIEEEVSFFKKLVEYTRDPVYVLSPSQGWRLVYANQAACTHFGVTLEELQEKCIPDWDLGFDMSVVDFAFQQMKKDGQSVRFETLHQVASGGLCRSR